MGSKRISGLNIWRRVIAALLLIAIVGMLAAIAYLARTPKPGGGFTDFYILGLTGKTENYPTRLRVGEEGQVIGGIVNREQKTVTYRIEITVDGSLYDSAEGIELEEGGEWRGTLSFSLNRVGERQRVEFLLYRQGDSQPYRELRLWVNGREPVGN